MKKVNTQFFGPKNILKKEKIEGTDLYIAEIYSDFRRRGIINEDGEEVVPFGTLYHLIGTRLIDENHLIIDRVVDTHFVFGALLGSYLCHKVNGKFELLYNSNAAILLVNEKMILGANFVTGREREYHIDYPLQSFEYNYKTRQLDEQKNFNNLAYANGELLEYLMKRYLPYEEEYHKFEILRRRIGLKEVVEKMKISEYSWPCEGLIFHKKTVEKVEDDDEE